MPREYPIQTLDGGTGYKGIAGLEQLFAIGLPDDVFGNPPYGKKVYFPDGREFVYCYTALTTIYFGGLVAIDTTGSTTSGKNPNATIPIQNTTTYCQFGIACETVGVAGGIWVQTYGRCCYARLDGATDVTLGAHLKPVTGVQYMAEDHDTVPSTNTVAIYERCRNGAAGSTKWGNTWETVADFPWYDIAQTIAYGSQLDTTRGDPSNQVFLTGKRAIIT